ncbi:MAG: pyridoxamine 5'-phosphate oxidase family protein [Sedimentisphaerales bacterium]|nr:pyridoxamine 5'-phosphate oxidase family protein [Sedimentisphaerales bacterium]
MELKEYFANTSGHVILSTMDNNGKVDSAVYSSPRFFDDGRIGFIMRENLSYENVRANPHVCLLFIEDGGGHKGKRLYLKKVDETDDKDLIESLLKKPTHGDDEDPARHLVYFELVKERPLVGDRV